MCKFNGDSRSVENYFNPGQITPILIDSNQPSLGLSEINITSNQGYLICSFKRTKNLKESSKYFDLNEKYFLFIAKGNIEDGFLKIIIKD